MIVLIGVNDAIWVEKAYFCRVVNKNYMTIKKKEIIETKEAVQLPKVEKVRPDYAHFKLAPHTRLPSIWRIRSTTPSATKSLRRITA